VIKCIFNQINKDISDSGQFFLFQPIPISGGIENHDSGTFLFVM